MAAVISGLLVVGALAACSSSGADSGSGDAVEPAGGAGLVNSWSLTSAAVDSSDLSSFGITITFTDTEASGFGGVNNYTTSFTSGPEGDLDFGEIASTKMAGSDEAMQAETAYLAALGTVTGYTVTGNELDLFAGEQEILTYTMK
jgi:heat shock protein HslJ